jgi:hypothetical protein
VPHYAYVLPAISETLEVAWRHPLPGCLYCIALLMWKSITSKGRNAVIARAALSQWVRICVVKGAGDRVVVLLTRKVKPFDNYLRKA